jgi:BMFP domain-containing protein YqiC
MVTATLGLVFQIAQVDPISGGAGWVGAGLLGLVLGWLLLKHLPDKDKKEERLIAGRDQMVHGITTEFSKSLRERDELVREVAKGFAEQVGEVRHEFRDALQQILSRQDLHIARLAASIRQEFEDGKQQVAEARAKGAV